MWTDFHCHCLPAMDDGAADVKTASDILKKLAQQNVSTVVASPHFCFEKEDLGVFIKLREQSYETLKASYDCKDFPKILLGAEVLLERDLSSRDLTPLCIEGTNLLLLEFKYGMNKNWMLEELVNITYKYSIIPVLAHFERYADWLSEEDYKKYFEFDDVIIQINTNSLRERFCRKLIKTACEYNKTIVFGSDSHNNSTRAPSFNLISKKNRFINKYSEYIIYDIDKLGLVKKEKRLIIDNI